MTDEEKEIIKECIEKRVPDLKCPACGRTKFVLASAYSPFQLQEEPKKVSVASTSLLPSIAVICSYCGYTMFFNLLSLGALKKSQD